MKERLKEELKELEEKYSFWEDTEKSTNFEGATTCNCGGGSCNSCSSGCGDI